MDADKVNEAIKEYARMCSVDVEGYDAIKQAVQYGVELTMQQPLADRLTDVEKAKARAAYNRAEECYNDNADDMSYAAGLVVKTVFREIFGKELFNEK